MSELQDTLQKIMSDPEAMRQVQSLGKQLGLGESTPAPPPAPVQSPVSGDMMAAFSKLAPLMNAAKPSDETTAAAAVFERRKAGTAEQRPKAAESDPYDPAAQGQRSVFVRWEKCHARF